MKILIVRHADPDYEHDSLTEKGFREAALLGGYMIKKYPHIDEFYYSSFGRAKKTFEAVKQYYPSSPSLECPWLIEFQGLARRDDRDGNFANCWDLLPSQMEKFPELYSSSWRDSPLLNEEGATVLEEYGKVVREFDKILEKNGYKRSNLKYEITESNDKVIAFFCHYGVASVLMSHLMNCPPYSLWENIVLLPSSVTEFVSEERRKGIASFRANKIGSISHLDMANEEESFSARFCERYEDDTRHD